MLLGNQDEKVSIKREEKDKQSRNNITSFSASWQLAGEYQINEETMEGLPRLPGNSFRDPTVCIDDTFYLYFYANICILAN